MSHPRLAQYISMFPAKEEDEELRQGRVASWRNRTAPGRFAIDPRHWEETHNPTAELTTLGEKLIGLARW